MKKLLLGLLISTSGYSNYIIKINYENATKDCEYSTELTPNVALELATSKAGGFTHCVKIKLFDGITSVMCDEPSTYVWFFADNFAICQSKKVSEIIGAWNKKIEIKNGAYKIKK